MLPIYSNDDAVFTQMQTQWAAQLNPVITQAPNQGLILKSVSLVTGSNTINHTLGRNLQGWILVRVRALATVYDEQDSNPLPAKTLVLVSATNVVVDIWVF